MRRLKSRLTWQTMLGEIALIFVGISLAIWFNNWNDKRKQDKLEKEVLYQIYADVESNLGDVESDLETLQLSLKSQVNVENYMNEDLSYADSMCFDFYWLKQDEYTFPVRSGYDNLKSIGLELIKSDTTREIIQRIYDSGFSRISRATPFHPDLDAFFTPYYQKHFVPNDDKSLLFVRKRSSGTMIYPYPSNAGGVNDLVIIGYVPKDFEALKKDPEFKMLLHQAKEYRRYKIRHYQNVLFISKYLINRIAKELELPAE